MIPVSIRSPATSSRRLLVMGMGEPTVVLAWWYASKEYCVLDTGQDYRAEWRALDPRTLTPAEDDWHPVAAADTAEDARIVIDCLCLKLLKGRFPGDDAPKQRETIHCPLCLTIRKIESDSYHQKAVVMQWSGTESADVAFSPKEMVLECGHIIIAVL